MKIKTRFSYVPLGYFGPNFVCNLSGTRRHDAGHMTKMAAMSVHGKLKSLLIWYRWSDFNET